MSDRQPFRREQPIDTAPKDGTWFYGWDGVWWRIIRWHAKKDSYGVEGWRHAGFLSVKPISWHPVDEEYEALIDNILLGNRASPAVVVDNRRVKA